MDSGKCNSITINSYRMIKMSTCLSAPPMLCDEKVVANVRVNNYDRGLRNTLQFVFHMWRDSENPVNRKAVKLLLCGQKMIWICEYIKDNITIITLVYSINKNGHTY